MGPKFSMCHSRPRKPVPLKKQKEHPTYETRIPVNWIKEIEEEYITHKFMECGKKNSGWTLYKINQTISKLIKVKPDTLVYYLEQCFFWPLINFAKCPPTISFFHIWWIYARYILLLFIWIVHGNINNGRVNQDGISYFSVLSRTIFLFDLWLILQTGHPLFHFFTVNQIYF